MEQQAIKFPAPPAPVSRQLDIAACGTNISLRYVFRIPMFSKSGKLSGFTGTRVILSNLIDDEGLDEFCNGDVNKLAQLFMASAVRKVMKENGLKTEQFIEFRGIDVCRHRPLTKPQDNDPRWV